MKVYNNAQNQFNMSEESKIKELEKFISIFRKIASFQYNLEQQIIDINLQKNQSFTQGKEQILAKQA